MTRRVLLTGATGFIGRHTVAPLLARGFEVHAISCSRAGENGGAQWHRANLLLSTEVARVLDHVRPSHLVHLAWYMVPGKWAEAPENYEWVRVSLELLQRFAAQGGSRTVVAGSGFEYDWTAGYCSETRTPRRPHTFYGACKNALQELWAGYAERVGVSSAWARVFFVYGPGEHPDRLVAHVVRKLLAGEEAKCSHGRQIRDYLYVQDVADALAALADSDVSGPVNVASGQPIALKDFIGRIADAIGRSDLIRLGAIPPASSDVPLVIGDTQRLENALRFRPTVDLARGIAKTIQWWSVHDGRTIPASRPSDDFFGSEFRRA